MSRRTLKNEILN